MKKRMILTAVCVMLLFGALSEQRAQSSTRIKFRRGAVHADVSGSLNSFKSKRTFLIRVLSNRTLRVEQVGGSRHPITIYINDPYGNEVGDSDASCNNRREIPSTDAGDYTIEVVECRKADPWRGRFTFRVTVR